MHPNPNLRLNVYDGSSIADTARPDVFDAVLSLNVLESFHPDDAEGHFNDVYKALKRGGEYILKTPRLFFGPHGIERVFHVAQSRGLHLKEYAYSDIRKFSDCSGFLCGKAVLLVPGPVRTFQAFEIGFRCRRRIGYELSDVP